MTSINYFITSTIGIDILCDVPNGWFSFIAPCFNLLLLLLLFLFLLQFGTHDVVVLKPNKADLGSPALGQGVVYRLKVNLDLKQIVVTCIGSIVVCNGKSSCSSNLWIGCVTWHTFWTGLINHRCFWWYSRRGFK